MQLCRYAFGAIAQQYNSWALLVAAAWQVDEKPYRIIRVSLRAERFGEFIAFRLNGQIAV